MTWQRSPFSLKTLDAAIDQLEGLIRQNHEICQILGRALCYPRNADGTIDVGNRDIESLALEAATEIECFRARQSHYDD